MIRVLVVDDHAVVRQGLRFLLEQEDGVAVVGDSADGAHALADVRALKPDVMLLDLIMPPPDGLQVLAAVSRDHPDVKVVVLTSSPDDDHVVRALRLGAVSYLTKTAKVDEISAAVRAAARGEGLLRGPDLARLVGGRPAEPRPNESALELLTPRETEVLSWIARGRTNRDIARTLVISEETVKKHVSQILAKLGVQDRTQAAIVALQARLVPLDERERGPASSP
jgi:two-component system, NarL family, response regulator LiaR